MNYHLHYLHKHQREFLGIDCLEDRLILCFRILNRDAGTNRIPSLRMPTMGVYVPNMYLAPTNINGNRSTNENQQVIVRDSF
jgi:hypothetical protein